MHEPSFIDKKAIVHIITIFMGIYVLPIILHANKYYLILITVK